jgi:hypothetical protein
MKNLPLLTISLLAMLALGACKKEKPCKDPSNPKCENYDPCYGKKAPSADFIIGQSSAQPYFGMDSYEFISDDTIFAPFYWPIDFMAKEQGAEYEWKLGAETITARRFTRGFSNAGYGRYTATLTIRKEVDNSCFPEYTGTATFTKNFEIRPFYEFPIVGKYKVLFEGEKDSSIIQIQPWEMLKEGSFNNPYTMINDKSENKLMLINFSNGKSAEADTVPNTVLTTKMLFSGNKLYTRTSYVDHANIELKEGKFIFAEYTLIYPDPVNGGPNQYFPGIKFKGIKID